MEVLQPTIAYITEIDIRIQMIDMIMPLYIAKNYFLLFKSFFHRGSMKKDKDISTTPPLISITSLRNEDLPLIYLEFKGFRLMLPSSKIMHKQNQHDLIIMEVCL